jgi:hypothetical protein
MGADDELLGCSHLRAQRGHSRLTQYQELKLITWPRDGRSRPSAASTLHAKRYFMKTRREVIQAVAAISLGALYPYQGLAHARGEDAGIKFGAQTNAWAIDPQKPDSFFEVLRQVKQIGYDGFETGFLNLSSSFDAPVETAQRIASTGLTFFGIHIFLPPDKWDGVTRLPPSALYEKVVARGRRPGRASADPERCASG